MLRLNSPTIYTIRPVNCHQRTLQSNYKTEVFLGELHSSSLHFAGDTREAVQNTKPLTAITSRHEPDPSRPSPALTFQYGNRVPAIPEGAPRSANRHYITTPCRCTSRMPSRPVSAAATDNKGNNQPRWSFLNAFTSKNLLLQAKTSGTGTMPLRCRAVPYTRERPRRKQPRPITDSI